MRSLGIALVAIVIAMAVIVPVYAADAPAAIGTVDVPAVFQGYQKTELSNSTLESLRAQLVKELQTLSETRLLDENQSKELIELVRKPNPTDSDKQRIAALQDAEKALDKELKDLQAKKEPTEQEKARQNELQARIAKSDDNIASIKDQSEQQFEAKKEELSGQIRDDIIKAIEDVAKSKGMALVVDKMAVLYGGDDITEAVLEKLNGKKK